MRGPNRQHRLHSFRFTKSFIQGSWHGKTDVLAQALWSQASLESVEGQFVLGRCMELWIAALGVELHIRSEGAKALSISAVTVYKLLPALVIEQSLAKPSLQC